MSNNQVRLSGFENCCGVFVMNNFFNNFPYKHGEHDFRDWNGYNNQEDVDRKYNIPQGRNEDTEKWKKRIKASAEDLIRQYKNKKSYFLAVLNKEEKELHDVLLDVGFEVLVPETRNPTGTSITMYIYHLLPKEIKKAESILQKAS